MGPGVLRAITGPRGPRGAETLAEKWRRLSRAEQIALGGTLMAALAGGGWLLSGAARSGGGGGGAIPPPAQEPKEPLDSTNKADFRTKETEELLVLYDSDASKRAEIAEFCACRIHDVRDLLLDPTHVKTATEIIELHIDRIKQLNIAENNKFARCRTAQLSFLSNALGPSATFISNSLGPKAAPTFVEHRFGTKKDIFDEFLQNNNEEFVSEQFEQATEKEDEFSKYLRMRTEKPVAETAPSEWNDDLKQQKREQWDNEKVKTLPDRTNRTDDDDPDNPYPNHDVYGHVSTWDVRGVKGMAGAFANTGFEMDEHLADMSFWDTREVDDMSNMFSNALTFNGDITNWDTRNVTNMSNMFHMAVGFDQDIGQWDTSEVIDMSGMFTYALKFSQNLSNWVVKQGVKHDNMFEGSSMETENTKHPKFEDTSSFGRDRKSHAAHRAYV
jgi:surface protein